MLLYVLTYTIEGNFNGNIQSVENLGASNARKFKQLWRLESTDSSREKIWVIEWCKYLPCTEDHLFIGSCDMCHSFLSMSKLHSGSRDFPLSGCDDLASVRGSKHGEVGSGLIWEEECLCTVYEMEGNEARHFIRPTVAEYDLVFVTGSKLLGAG